MSTTEQRVGETVTTTEAMEILGVSRPTITRLIQQGELKAHRLTPASTSPFRIYVSSIEAVMRRREVS